MAFYANLRIEMTTPPTKPQIIGISGKKRSGKDTLASLIAKNSLKEVERIAFADSLKEELAKACGVTVETIENNKAQYRLGLQWWGTEFRRAQCRNYWLDRFREKVNASTAELIVVPDVRFHNEADLVRELGGKVIRVTRPLADEDRHASEIEMDSYNFDTVVHNNGTVEDLEAVASALTILSVSNPRDYIIQEL